MKKKIINRGLLGFPLGIAIGYIVSILVSLCAGDGMFHFAKPELVEKVGSELNAVILQTVLSGILGAGFAMSSVIWEIETWSLAKQTGIYFAVICLVMFPISYVAKWMPNTVGGVISYIAIFLGIFIVTWLIQYLIWKSKIKKINEKVKDVEKLSTE
ncbi:MAG: hypothetical protein BWX78_00632 [Firmicutes bacterium ADurb.Bin099]|nr:MAG: hypothetical protein BWX78_00632 [Firmicutes bacterium ADurb.Bin099]